MFTSNKNCIRYPLLFLIAAVMLLPAADEKQTAQACWNAVVTECFSRPFSQFPWENPPGTGRRWRRNPNFPTHSNPSWGIQEVVYSVRMSGLCGNDIQSCWMLGGSGTYDPDFDKYPPNRNIYMTYGPFSLTAADEGVVMFELYCNSEFMGDSIWWGVADNANLDAANNLLIDSSFSGYTVEQFGQPWAWIQMDLSDLHDADGEPGSALGWPTVYAFWRFTSNSNSVPNEEPPLHGAFVDNVIIQWDDGMIDLEAGGMLITHADSVDVVDELTVGDTVRTRFVWQTCAGGSDEYPPTRIVVTVTDPLGFDTAVLDTVIEEVVQDSTYTWYTPPWQFEMAENHIVTLEIDPDDEIAESSEDNNSSQINVYAWPPNPHPEFVWLQPSLDTLSSDSLVMLKWEAYDIGETANISIYVDTDTEGCFGNAVPGGIGLIEIDGPDSIAYDIHNLFVGHLRWPFAIINDSQWDTCVYAPYPVLRIETDAVQMLLSGVPDEFFLTQNYPNPFNPETEIRYGITRAGPVALTVYDLLGREVAELVNQNLAAGAYVVNFNGHDLSSGVYLYTLATPEGVKNRKMILMK